VSKHNAQGTDVEEIQYADTFVIDEGGIDLQYAGESVLSASFDHVDNFQLAYEVLPEGYTVFPKEESDAWHESLEALTTMTDRVTDVELELGARLFLTALAERRGYVKK
jgi:hypothetical protein